MNIVIAIRSASAPLISFIDDPTAARGTMLALACGRERDAIASVIGPDGEYRDIECPFHSIKRREGIPSPKYLKRLFQKPAAA